MGRSELSLLLSYFGLAGLHTFEMETVPLSGLPSNVQCTTGAMNRILCAMRFSASSVNRRSAWVFTYIFGVATADPRSTLRLTQPALVQCYPARHDTAFSVPHILNLAVRSNFTNKKAWTQRQKWTNLGSKLCVSTFKPFNLPPLNAAKQLVVWLYPELTARRSRKQDFQSLPCPKEP